MDIPNLSPINQEPQPTSKFSFPLISIIIVLAITLGFWLSRISPTSKSGISNNSNTALSTDSISNTDELQVGKLYGNLEKDFSDKATGVIKQGNINGEGTHILLLDGSSDRKASLTSSSVDLDLFVDKKVEVKGQTNASSKTGWLLDVGNIKILE